MNLQQRFDNAPKEAAQALLHFWNVHAALMRTLEKKP